MQEEFRNDVHRALDFFYSVILLEALCIYTELLIFCTLCFILIEFLKLYGCLVE